MCVAMLAAGAAGGGLSTVMTVMSGVMGMMNAMNAAETANANAEAAEEAAVDRLKAGERDSDISRRRTAQTMGNQKVAMAANGVDVNSASAIDMLDDTKFLGEEDAFAVREQARFDAQGQQVRAANYRNDATSAKMSGFGSILTAGGKVASKWESFA